VEPHVTRPLDYTLGSVTEPKGCLLVLSDNQNMLWLQRVEWMADQRTDDEQSRSNE